MKIIQFYSIKPYTKVIVKTISPMQKKKPCCIKLDKKN